MLDKKMNLRRDKPSRDALDEFLVIMAAIMAGGRCLCNLFLSGIFF
jgi:hypothetical protein